MASQPGTLDLLDVPAALADHGYHTMELCHFHLPSTDGPYLEGLRKRIEDHRIELWSTLIDDGNLNDPEHADRDLRWTSEWIVRAAALGSRCVRVVAGKAPSSDASIRKSAESLERLIEVADPLNVRVLTENWFDTLNSPAAVDQLFDLVGPELGLCFDFGNWGDDDKYENLVQIAGYADSCHAKCQYIDGKPGVEDFARCLQITRDAGFNGPYTLVHGEHGRVWETLDEQRNLIGLGEQDS